MNCLKSVRMRSYSGPHFPAFGLNTERYGVSFHIQSECGKIRTRITPNMDTFKQFLKGSMFKAGLNAVFVFQPEDMLNCAYILTNISLYMLINVMLITTKSALQTVLNRFVCWLYRLILSAGCSG